MTITEQAQIELKKALNSFNKPGAGIHIFNTQGCCGPSVQMDITTHIENGESIISLQDIDFFVADALLPDLTNVTIEFDTKGFKLNGLQKSGSCCD